MTIGQQVTLYWRMSRPSQLLAVILVYSWGILIGLHEQPGFQPVAVLTPLVPLLLVSASIHFANEYADHETDAITTRTPFSGGSGALSDFEAPPGVALTTARVSLMLGLSTALGLYLTGPFPLIALLILLLGGVGGWMYSLPPPALAWRGWGELTNALLGGMLLPAFGFTVQAGYLEPQLFLLVSPFGLYVFNNLLATTWADRRADGQVGKYTLATRWPRQRLSFLYYLLVAAAFLILFLIRGWLAPAATVWPSFLLLPLALWAGRAYTRQHSPFPSVLVMVAFLLVQLSAWSAVTGFSALVLAGG